MGDNEQPARFIITAELDDRRLAVLDLDDFVEEYITLGDTPTDTLHELIELGKSNRPKFRVSSLIDIGYRNDGTPCTSKALYDAVLQYYPKAVKLIRRCVLTGGDNPLLIIRAKNGATYGIAQKDGGVVKSPVQIATTIHEDGVLSLPTFIRSVSFDPHSTARDCTLDYSPIIDVRTGTLVKSIEDLCSIDISTACQTNQLTFRSELCQLQRLRELVLSPSAAFERRHKSASSNGFTITVDLVYPWNLSRNIDLYGSFEGRKNLTGVYFSKRTRMNVVSCTHTFRDCSSLREVSINNISTAGCRDFSCMFYGCSSLVDLDLFRFDFGDAESLFGMFMRCKSLRHIYFNDLCSDGADFCDYDCMFQDCDSLRPENVEGIGSPVRISSSVMHELCDTVEQRGKE